MESSTAVLLLAALAHPARLELFRALIKESPNELAAGVIALRLGIPANTLSFHLKELLHAGLLSSRRDGRSIFYKIESDTVRDLLFYLTEDCCQGRPELCRPSCC